MSRRAARRQRSRERRIRESLPERRRQMITRLSLVTVLVAVVLGVVIGGVFYTGSRSSGQPQLASSTGLEVGSDVGNHVPGFDLRLARALPHNTFNTSHRFFSSHLFQVVSLVPLGDR